AGMDITPHGGNPRTMVIRVRNWLFTVSKRKTIPTQADLLTSYDNFVEGLPGIAAEAGAGVDDLAFADYERLTLAWIKASVGAAQPQQAAAE
ncbi:hypothetical protein AB4144_60540, partial [Rhizobiaceae sp. 2RAB30]